jgi:hypothetical protein
MFARPVMFLSGSVPAAMSMAFMTMMVMFFATPMMAAPAPMAESMLVLHVMLRIVLFQGHYDFFQKLAQLLSFHIGQRREDGFSIFQVLFLMLLRHGSALFRDGNNEIAFVLIGSLPGGEAVSFQFCQNLAQGGGTHIQHLHQVALAHRLSFFENGKHMRLRMLCIAAVMVVSGHSLQNASEESKQGFAGYGASICHF